MTEPVSLAMIKVHLRLDASDTGQDAYLSTLITAARRACEGQINRSAIGAPAQIELDTFPGSQGWTVPDWWPIEVPQRDVAAIMLPGGFVSAVGAITYRDGNGNTQTIDPASTVLDLARTPARVYSGTRWPLVGNPGLVRVSYTVSPLSPDDTAVVAQAAQLLVESWYSHRSALAVDTRGVPTEVPLTVSWLLQPLRQFAID